MWGTDLPYPLLAMLGLRHRTVVPGTSDSREVCILCTWSKVVCAINGERAFQGVMGGIDSGYIALFAL